MLNKPMRPKRRGQAINNLSRIRQVSNVLASQTTNALTNQSNNTPKNQANSSNNKTDCVRKENTVINSIGNVFLLGMTVLISEIIDLTAAKSLDYLLEPCLPKEPEEEQVLQEALATDIAANIAGITDIGALDAEFIPIAFE